ncbi:hypothetical protein HAX54_029385, partial [Datura stramonium]|nr:hypothetical protein [Datura stramonium]
AFKIKVCYVVLLLMPFGPYGVMPRSWHVKAQGSGRQNESGLLVSNRGNCHLWVPIYAGWYLQQ